jgi:hypothetical protein
MIMLTVSVTLAMVTFKYCTIILFGQLWHKGNWKDLSFLIDKKTVSIVSFNDFIAKNAPRNEFLLAARSQYVLTNRVKSQKTAC